MSIGGIQPAQEVIVRIQLLTHLEIEAGAYCLRVPTAYFIKNSNGGVDGAQVNAGIATREVGAPAGAQYSFKIEINTSNAITYVSVPSHSKVTKVTQDIAQPQSGHLQTVLIEKTNANASDLKKDIVVYFSTRNMDRPQLLAQAHPDKPDEIACMISLVPTFVPPEPQDQEAEITEDEKPEEVDSIVIPGQQEKDNVFVFIVDRSGSMSGKKMDMTKEALKLFIQSLPAGCMFEIISFGTRYTVSSKGKSGYHNDDKSVKQIKAEIDLYTADMGGTEIYEPLKFTVQDFHQPIKKATGLGKMWKGQILETYNKLRGGKKPAGQQETGALKPHGMQEEEKKGEEEPHKNKKVFLLTDGAVSNPDKVIELAKSSSDKTRIHSFGVGYGCSKYLVKEVAKAGRGSYSFVDEKSENLKGKVITALRRAVEPSLKGCSFSYMIEGGGSPLHESPFAGYVGEAFRHDMLDQCLIVNRDQFENLKVAFRCTEDPVSKSPINFEFTSSDFKMLEPGDFLFKLAAKKRAKELYELIESAKEAGKVDEQERMTNDIVKLSVKYQILTKDTAFVGVIKQDNKTTGELVKVVIPTTVAEGSRRGGNPSSWGI